MRPYFCKLIETEDQISFKKSIPVIAPLNGKVRPLESYPSLLYKERMFGEGVAVEINGYQLIAPFDCQIEQLYPTAEQIRLRSSIGLRMQIQLGLNTETLMGNGFRLHCAAGDKLKRGSTILEFDLPKMKEKLSTTMSAITILNSDKLKGVKPNYLQVRANEDVLFNLYV